jgi:hypothetical protein
VSAEQRDCPQCGNPFTDEALHITGAFQLAGYPQVIGSLWPVLDSANSALCDLDAAIHALREAVDATPANDPDRAR